MTEENLQESSDTVIAVLDAPPETAAERRQKKAPKRSSPKRDPSYHVVIWNDPHHSFDYVIALLQDVFGHSRGAARDIANEVDKSGKGIAWTCHQELAELKRDQVVTFWQEPTVPYPLRSTIEEAPE